MKNPFVKPILTNRYIIKTYLHREGLTYGAVMEQEFRTWDEVEAHFTQVKGEKGVVPLFELRIETLMDMGRDFLERETCRFGVPNNAQV